MTFPSAPHRTTAPAPSTRSLARQRTPSVAVVCYSFPTTTQAFHHRRVRVMAEMGALHAVYYVKEGSGLIEDRSASIAKQATRISSTWWRTVLQLCRPAILLLFVRCVLLARRGNSEGGPIGAAWQAAKGVQLGLQLRSTDATIVHATFATAPATVALFAAKVADLPLSIEVHSPSAAFSNPRLMALKLRAASVVFAISRYAEQLVKTLAPRVVPEIVHCGIDIDGGSATETAPESGGSNLVVAVGSLQPKKGYRTLIAASVLLAEKVPHSVAIAGDGPDRLALQAEIRRLGAPVELLGELPPDSVARLRGEASVGVLASVRASGGNEDGIPVALMEFMADGVPVVGTDVAGISELLRDGEAGALARPGCHHSLASALETALTDRKWRQDRTAAGRRIIEEDFSNSHETRRLLARLDSVAVGGQSSTSDASRRGTRRWPPTSELVGRLRNLVVGGAV